MSYRIDGPIVETIGHGTYTTAQLASVFQAIKRDPRFRPPPLLLVDLRESAIHHSFDDVRTRLALIKEQLAPTRIAFLVAGEARERLARIYQTRAAEADGLPVEVFTDPEPAREWLKG